MIGNLFKRIPINFLLKILYKIFANYYEKLYDENVSTNKSFIKKFQTHNLKKNS